MLAAGLRVVFCGINPGRVSAAAAAHFANPRNDFWRLLHEAGFTARVLAPREQFSAVDYGIGLTNAAFRTTKGSGDLRKGDFAGSAERLERLAVELRPRALAFVGKEAYRGAFGERPDLGLQERTLADTGLFVLPSTSPANASVRYGERLRSFRALREWAEREPVERFAVRALVLDEQGRTLLLRWERPLGTAFWVTPGGAVKPGETPAEALRRELEEEAGLGQVRPGPCLWTREFVFPWRDGWLRQSERYYLVRPSAASVRVPDLSEENIHEHRWWTANEIGASDGVFAPSRLAELLRDLADDGPPPAPIDVGI